MNHFINMMLLPSKPKIISDEKMCGVYEISDLYPGYGHTLGNALRRIILSSTSGIAPVTVKIKGVNHEFSTIDGVHEDVLSIILNIKRLNIKVLDAKSSESTITLKKKGIGPVKASDFKLPTGVSIVNTDHHIAEITNAKTELDMEVTIDQGIGFLSRERNIKLQKAVGTINLDATFSPVRAVSYEVNDMRVGNRTDFNKLTITIKTDGTASPNDVLQSSIEIMIKQLQAITGFRGSEDEILSPEDTQSDAKRKIIDLPISAILLETLDEENIKTISDLVKYTEADLMKLKGVGEKTLQDLKNVIAEYGFVLKQSNK